MCNKSRREKSVENYETFLTKRESLELPLPASPYGWTELPRTLPISWMAYSQFLQEQARELSNSVNEFRRLIFDISAWQKVIDDLEGEDFHQAVREFVSPTATLALLMPSTIKSRFIYSIAHLSNQANRLVVKNWRDDLPIDKEIQFNQADQYGSSWTTYKRLKSMLEKIADKKYAKETHDFRNSFAHRYSPRIELGLTGLVTRYVSADGEVSYGFGETKPLRLAEIAPVLCNQHALCIAAYRRYQDFVNEQCVAIKEHITERCS